MTDNYRQRFIKMKQEFLRLVRRESYMIMRSVQDSDQDIPSQSPNDFVLRQKSKGIRFMRSFKVLA